MVDKNKVVPKEKEKEDDKILKDILKKYGQIITSINKLESTKPNIIEFSPSLDMILGGGIPEGTFTTVAGNSKSGKSSSVIHFAKKCQKLGKEIFYINVEGRLNARDVIVNGLDSTNFHIIGSEEEAHLTAEQYLEIIETLVKNKRGSLIIIDSISALSTEAEMTSEISKQQMGDSNKLLFKFFRRICGILRTSKVILIGIDHLIANLGYGKKWQERGGGAVQYFADQKLLITRSEAWTIDETQIGIIPSWTCLCSSIGRPGRTADSYIRFGQGIDELYEYMKHAIDTCLIDKKGAWYTLSFMEQHLDVIGAKDWEEGEKLVKFQGETKLYEGIKNNEAIISILKEKIKEIIN